MNFKIGISKRRLWLDIQIDESARDLTVPDDPWGYEV